MNETKIHVDFASFSLHVAWRALRSLLVSLILFITSADFLFVHKLSGELEAESYFVLQRYKTQAENRHISCFNLVPVTISEL